jgi:hypothetical protein
LSLKVLGRYDDLPVHVDLLAVPHDADFRAIVVGKMNAVVVRLHAAYAEKAAAGPGRRAERVGWLWHV